MLRKRSVIPFVTFNTMILMGKEITRVVFFQVELKRVQASNTVSLAQIYLCLYKKVCRVLLIINAQTKLLSQEE